MEGFGACNSAAMNVSAEFHLKQKKKVLETEPDSLLTQ